jgi:hypothetical protein
MSKIQPRALMPQNNQVAFVTDELNTLQRVQYLDRYNAFQEAYGVFNWMTLNRDMKYVVHSIDGDPMMWQPHNSCSIDKTKSLQIGVREVDPCRVAMRETLCHDELFDSCYRHFLEYQEGGSLELTEEGRNLLDQVVNTILTLATKGLRLTLTMGNYFDVSSVSWADNVTQNQKDNFTKTAAACTGWVTTLRTKASEATPHLNLSSQLQNDDFNVNNPDAEFLNLYDNLYDNAPEELQDLIDVGPDGGFAGEDAILPIFVVSPSMHKIVRKSYLRQNEAVMSNEKRIEKITLPNSTVNVYVIDGAVPIIPIKEIGIYDKYVTGKTYFAGFMASGVISLGSSFGAITDINNEQVGVIAERTESITAGEAYGTWAWQSHALLATAIADTNYVCAAQVRL